MVGSVDPRPAINSKNSRTRVSGGGGGPIDVRLQRDVPNLRITGIEPSPNRQALLRLAGLTEGRSKLTPPRPHT